MESTSGIERNSSPPKERATFRHPDTWVSESGLGKMFHEFRQTFDFPSEFLGTDFTKLIEDSPKGMLVRKIKGWLRTADALKIYELAYFTDGAILELGTYQGLATSVIATAVRNSGRQREFTSVDHNPAWSMAANANLVQAGLIDCVELRVAEAVSFIDYAIATERQYGFIFVDHSHAYKDMIAACIRLDRITAHGGFVLFHDFNDSRNRRDNFAKAGVFQAVQESVDLQHFEFYGTYGCCGLYRRR
ncbi:MAG: class I SAM-dependent methyltransferase [Deltaproteobacteria bacterium]|nr:class I SAM-dependent methyltransferase [Deltaproteobacteria bacterium]